MYHVCVGQSGSTQTPVHSVVSLFNTVGIPLNGGKAQKLRLVPIQVKCIVGNSLWVGCVRHIMWELVVYTRGKQIYIRFEV